MELLPLDPLSLSAEAQRAVAPGPMKMMAARGLAPLPNPVDMLSVLYLLSTDSDAATSQSANQSARDLPEVVARGGLADSTLPGSVLHFFATQVVGSTASLLEAVILNSNTPDVTIAAIAKTAAPAHVDMIAENDTRVIRHPEIVAAIYVNKRARMSTVDRVIEVAIRNNVKVPSIPAWGEIVKSVLKPAPDAHAAELSSEQMDSMFATTANQLAQDEEGEDDEGAKQDKAEDDEDAAEIPISQMTIPMKIRLATLGNSFARSQLIRDPIKLVSIAAIKSPGVTDVEAAKYASNNQLPDEVITYIAGRRDWTKAYSVKVSLVNNPKTSIPTAIKLLPHLRERELRMLSKSRGIPSALSASVRKLIMARSGRK